MQQDFDPNAPRPYSPAIAMANATYLRDYYGIDVNAPGYDVARAVHDVAEQQWNWNKPTWSDKWIDGILDYAPYLMVGGAFAGVGAGAAGAAEGAGSAAAGSAGAGAGAAASSGYDALAAYYGGLGGAEGSIAGSGVLNSTGAALGGAGGAAAGAGSAFGGGATATLPPVTITGTSLASGGLTPLEMLGYTGTAGAVGSQALSQAPQQAPQQQEFNQAQDSQLASQQQRYDPLTMGTSTAPAVPVGQGGFMDSIGQYLNGSTSLESLGSSGLSSLLNGASNMNITDWAKLATTVAGAYAGSKGNDATSTSQSKEMDPRLAALVYGTEPTDPNSIAGSGFNWWQQNKTGINPLMQQGLDAQRNVYSDPSMVNQMRGAAQGLLGQGVAGNPFTSGQAMQPQQQMQQPQAPQQYPSGLLSNERATANQGLLSPQSYGGMPEDVRRRLMGQYGRSY